MEIESSLAMVPEAPTAHAYASSRETSFSPNSNPDLVQRKLSIASHYETIYPTLMLEPYHLRSDSKPSNVLAFLQNAAKREIADLVTVILPALEQFSQKSAEPLDRTVDLADLQAWWKTFLRFLFFVAETDDDIVCLSAERVEKLAKRLGDFKRFNAIRKRRKSLGDRYSFTMEVIIRAADKSLVSYVSEPSLEGLKKVVKKLRAAAEFMLDTMDLSRQIVSELEARCDFELNRLETSVVESLYTFARPETSVFFCLYTRWMDDEETIRYWIQKHCGIRGRLYADKWMKAYAEGCGKFVSGLKTRSSY